MAFRISYSFSVTKNLDSYITYIEVQMDINEVEKEYHSNRYV